ncbi:MAG: hypothetical protein GY846_08065 [Deltaproteobacteria bacterium]|nr:hypothetical protein [Deltaproteobacteria bacterium]
MRSFLCFISFMAFFSPLTWGTFAGENEGDRSSSSEARAAVSPTKITVMVAIYSIEIDTTFLGVAAEGNRNTENEIESRLLENGFEVIDTEQFTRKKVIEASLMKGDPLEANRIANDFGAQVLIHGEVRRSYVGIRQVLERPTRFFSNEIRLKAFETKTGQVLFSGYETRPPSGLGAAIPLEDATADLCNNLITAIKKHEKNGSPQVQRYELSVSNISFNSLPNFIAVLKKIEGLEKAQVNGFKTGHALIVTEYHGSLMKLAEQISRMKKIPVEVTELQSNKISIKVKE